VNSNIQARHRVARLGSLLVEGPFSIRPPEQIDDYGWLECEFRVTRRMGSVVESAAVYVDDSSNRETGFLPPIIRHVHWERAGDIRRALDGALDWPTAVVTLSYFEDARTEVNGLIQRMQERLASLPFVPFGLSADRSMPDIPTDDRGRIGVYSRNGLQSVEYAGPTSQSDTGLTDQVVHAINRLQALLRPIELHTGWRESYQFPLASNDLGGSHWWDYRTPALSQRPA